MPSEVKNIRPTEEYVSAEQDSGKLGGEYGGGIENIAGDYFQAHKEGKGYYKEHAKIARPSTYSIYYGYSTR